MTAMAFTLILAYGSIQEHGFGDLGKWEAIQGCIMMNEGDPRGSGKIKFDCTY
jgi:hypothetical protein